VNPGKAELDLVAALSVAGVAHDLGLVDEEEDRPGVGVFVRCHRPW